MTWVKHDKEILVNTNDKVMKGRADNRKAIFKFLRYCLAIYLSYIVLEGVYNGIKNKTGNYWGTAIGIGMVYGLITYKPDPSQEEQREAESENYLELKAMLQKQDSVLKNYGKYLELYPISYLEIRDSSELPHSKEDILKALVMKVLVCKDEEEADLTFLFASYLVQFQDGIGSKPLHRFGIESEEFIRIGKSDKARASSILKKHSADIEKYDSMSEAIEAEFKSFYKTLEKAKANRKRTLAQD